MKTIQELIGKEATERLNERYGILVDRLFVEEEESVGVFQIKFQVFTRKQLSFNPSTIERERLIGIGVAEIECALYDVLNFGKKIEQAIHLNHNLPKNGIHMHPAIYTELVKSERESMRKIEERLEQLNEKREIDG
jgi:tRNA nucleotidyltransferase/poly(A) polymerase